MRQSTSLDMLSYVGKLITEQFEENLFMVDRQWRISYINNCTAKRFNRPAQELIGKVLWEEFPYLLDNQFGQFYREAMKGNKAVRFEDYLPQSQSWFDVRAYPTDDGLMIYFQDITKRKIFEQEFHESEARFRNLSNASHEGIIIFQDGLILDLNHNVLDMYGYTCVEELIGQPVDNLFAPYSLPEIQKRVVQDSSESYEVTAIKKDGTYFPIERRGKSIEYHGRLARVITLQDLTRQKQNEQALRENEERYRILSEAAFEGLLLHRDGEILMTNEAFSRMCGYSVTDLNHMHVSQLITATTLKEFKERFNNGVVEGVLSGEARRKDGSSYFIEARSKQVEYQGQPVRLVAVRDITEIKRAEETLKHTQAQLLQSQKLESIGCLAGGIAHDFNNLLTVISGYSELALFKVAENTSLYDDLGEILAAADRAKNLIHQLLVFSRQQVMQASYININQVVSEMNKLLHRLLGEHIELSCFLASNLGEVLIDPHQFEQVIVNLAVNARDAISEGGTLTIETANVELDEAYHLAGHPTLKTGPYVMLAVSDSGSGMDEATQQKIFEPFFTTKPVGKGTGLGLSTVYGIVEEAGGYIWVYSEIGKGTTFKIYLPRVKSLPPIADNVPTARGLFSELTNLTRSEEIVMEEVQPSTYNILVVEDDQPIRELIYKVLTEAGHRVTLADNGQKALHILNETRTVACDSTNDIEMVITDIIMPGMGGRELIAELKQKQLVLKVMYISGYTDRVAQHQDFLEECDGFLQKPFTPRILLRKINELMQTQLV